jgi:hypothetical protein
MIAEQEVKKPQPIRRHKINTARRQRYQQARSRLGLSPNSTGSITWSELHPMTSFVWKYNTLAETVRWIITECFKAMHLHRLSDRAAVALHYASRGFGVARADIISQNRAPPIVIARYVAMVCTRRAGVGRNDCARRFHRDQTVVKLAEGKVGHFFEGINFNDFALSDTNASRPAFDGQSGGSLPS